MLDLAGYIVVRSLAAALQAVPPASGPRFGRILGRLICGFSGPHRRRTIEHLQLAYGANGEADDIARRCFEHLGRHIVEFLHLLRGTRPPLRFENAGVLSDAYARGRGVVAVSAHLGSFGLSIEIPRRLGLRAAGIVKRQTNERLLSWLKSIVEERYGYRIVLKNEARDEIPDLLREGYLVGLFADQHPRGGGFPATFFGRPVTAAAGPAVYAKRAGAPLVLVTMSVDREGTHVARIDGPIATDGTHEDVTQRWMSLLEERIREHPEQWMWMHRRWR